MATWVNPATGKITSVPGPRVSPGGIGSTNHGGWDIAGPTGTPIYAATGGTVTYSGWKGGYGNFIEVRQADGSYQRYGHMSGLNVSKGDTVEPGEQIGKMGSTGNSTGSHLHYENRGPDGKLQNPTGDGELNKNYGKNGNTKGGQKGDGSDGSKKKGEGEGDPSKKGDHDKTAKEKDPLKKGDKNDIKGSAGNYEKTSTSTIVGRMPTHEPWTGHPKSTEGPRQAIRGDGGANNGGAGTDADRGSGGSGGGSSGNPGGGGGGGGGGSVNDDGRATNPNGNQQQIGERIYDRLISKGYTPGAASAAVGNFMGEGLNKAGGYGTSIVNDPSGTGKPGRSRGIAQWRNERGVALENFSKGYEGGWRNIDAQVDFFDHELKTQYGGLYNKMRTSNDTASITRDLVYDFERPAERLRASTTQQRLANARGFENKRKAGQKPAEVRRGDKGMNQKDADGAPQPSEPRPSSGGGSSATPGA